MKRFTKSNREAQRMFEYLIWHDSLRRSKEKEAEEDLDKVT